jgi:PAS domain S-box-containing protein
MDKLYTSKIELQSSLVLRKSTILYIESDDTLYGTMKPLFDQVFQKAHATVSAKEAFETFQNSDKKIDIILVDMHIEDLSSIEFVQKVREIDQNIIIVISVLPFNEGSAEEYIEKSNNFYELIKLRINDLLQKPYQPMTTLKVLSKHLVARENEQLIENQKNALFNLKYMVDHQNLLSETDLKGNIIYANDKFSEISGFSKEELVGSPHNIVRHPDMEAKVFRQMWETIRSGKIWEGRIKNKKKDGGYYWVDAIVAPIMENGKIVKYMASRQDITELVDKEKLMRKEIKRIKSENYRDREIISKRAYDDGVQRYTREFENLKDTIKMLQKKLAKEEAKSAGSLAQIDKLIASEKAANATKDKVLSKAKTDIANLFEKTKRLEKEKHQLEKKLEDAVQRHDNLNNSLKDA